MKLIIVESPTKAKTLGRFLGEGYEVVATMGHIKDLPKSKLGVDVEHDFAPTFETVAKKTETIKKITTLAKKAEIIYLASDPDREGEAIAQHVLDVINAKKANAKKIKRISFHEITKEAVEKAIKNAGEIDNDLVDAQTARRVLDRLVGYKVSPMLWRKVRIGLSAGRVQTVAVRLIVEREREIEVFNPVEYWEIFADLLPTSRFQLTKIDGKKAEINDQESADWVVADLEKSNYQVSDVKKREVVKRPYPPYTTSTMTQAAARLFGWSAKRTMSVAQGLYEEGAITYHRTDSFNLSKEAVNNARQYIGKEYGEKYLPEHPNFYKNRAKNAQEAHEAIRPTDVGKKVEGNKLYDLIWKRFVSCQMAPAVYAETAVDVTANKYLLHVAGSVMKFDGWRKLYEEAEPTSEVGLRLRRTSEVDFTVGQKLDLVKVISSQKFTEPPARYNEASLIKTLEKLGIGRPSTYAPTINTIQLRNYVEKIDRVFEPTAIGIAVNDFLLGNFPSIFEYGFTAHMEDDLDAIANGKLEWVPVIREFYTPLAKILTRVEKTAERVKIATEKLDRQCPQCKGGGLIIRTGRFGKFISCDQFPECKYTEKIVTKVDGMKCPECQKGDVILKITKRKRKFYGCSRYPDCKFASWTKPILTLDQKGDNIKKDD